MNMPIESELKFQAAALGKKMQEGFKVNVLGRLIGRLLLSWGEPKVRIIRNKNTGVIERIRRRGDISG